MPALPKQGFDVNGQDPADYNPEEKAAAALVEHWIETVNHDPDAHMALIDKNILVRPDPSSSMLHGPGYYCSTFLPGLLTHIGTYPLNELYVAGGQYETDVLLRRTDINDVPRAQGFLGGYGVPVATFLRIRNGRIIEWEDMPTNKVSAGGLPFHINLNGPRKIRDACMKYAAGSSAPAPVVQPHALNYWYGTEKAEYLFNPDEESAAQTVRAWFGAWQSGDPLLLGAFVAQDVVFRADPTQELQHGRNNLLKEVCGFVGGKRKLIGLYVVGGDYDSSVMARWDETGRRGSPVHMVSFFRVQKGLITEWMYDRNLDAAPQAIAADSAQSSAGCRAVEAAVSPSAGS